MKPRVVDSIDDDAGDHCVDVFARDDGSFGFEEYRRDAEDGRGWFSLDRFSTLVFASQRDALAEARARVAWLAARDPFTIRRAVDEDAEAIEALYRDCRRDAPWLPVGASRAPFAQLSAGESIYVAATGAGEILGFVSAWEAQPFIHHLYVREENRRHGVAGALLAGLLGRLAFPWRLKCVCANTAALDFYAKRGWKRLAEGVGSEGSYYELQLDAWPG